MPRRHPGPSTVTVGGSKRSSGTERTSCTLIAQGVTLRGAQNGPGVYDYALAALIWHEMAHLGGSDERDAQRQEEDLWTQYVAGGLVDTRRGLNYLALLKKRR